MSGKKVRVKLHASRIREKARGGGEIEEYAQEILDNVSEDIEDALENEEKYSKTEVGTIFDVPCMSLADAQRDVYYLACQALVKSGYHPLIKFGGNTADSQHVFIYTSWETKQDEHNSNYKDDFLRQITMKPRTDDQKYQEYYKKSVLQGSKNSSRVRKRRIRPKTRRIRNPKF